MRALVLAVLLCPCAGGLQAQVIQGVVRDVTTGQPIVAAEVVATDARGREAGRAVSDSAGLFRVRLSSGGELLLRASRIGYTTVEGSTLRVDGGEVVTIEVRMAADAIPLEPLLVTARSSRATAALDGFHARVRGEGWGKFGLFVTRDQIDRRVDGTATELLRAMPQVTLVRTTQNETPFGVERNLIYITRHLSTECAPTIYVDGVRVPQENARMIDDILDPAALEGVEIYPSFPPPEFIGGDCGTVLFWRKTGQAGDRGFEWKRLFVGLAGVAALFFVLGN